ncbi:MAG: IclR family transcriptional regulator, partial [Pseudomonadota bacterium]|nr:IclR family transcriptional regulator [Pseudomonadota bacterium]
ALVAATGECAHLAVIAGDRALYVAQEAPQSGMSVDAPVGTLAPLHCTALGKVLLAFQAEPAREALIGRLRLDSFTRRTIAEPARLREGLQEVRRTGSAVDDEEFSVGVRCIAAPVRRHDGAVAGAIGISGPSPRVTNARLAEWDAVLREQADALSVRLGWHNG